MRFSIRPADAEVYLDDDYLGTGAQSYMPPYLAYVDPWMGETSADNRYVSVSGDDILPDMHIGRLSVGTPMEAAAIVDKILSYETTPDSGHEWDPAGRAGQSPDARISRMRKLGVSIKTGVAPEDTDRQQLYYFRRKTLARLAELMRAQEAA